MMRVHLLILLSALTVGFKGQAQPNLDSLWQVWHDKDQPDSSRLAAIHSIAWDGYLFSQPDSASYFATMLYDLAQSVGDTKAQASAQNIQGISASMRGDNSRAINYFLECLRIYEQMEMPDGTIGDAERIAASLGNVGNVYRALGDHRKALEYTDRILDIYKDLDPKNENPEFSVGIAKHMNNIGLDHAQLGDYDQAFENYKKSLAIYNRLGDQRNVASTMHNLGSMYAHLAETEPVEGQTIPVEMYYDSAMIYYQWSLEKAEQSGQLEGMVIVLNNIGTIHGKRGRYKKAIASSEQALAIAQRAGIIKEIKNSAENLAEFYEESGRYKKALKMNKLNVLMRDSIADIEAQRDVLKQDYEYKIEKQALADSLMFAHERVVAEASHKQKIDRRNWYVLGGIGLAALALLYFRIRQQRVAREKDLAVERERSERLEKIDHLKDQFLANTSHELLTPLNGIIGLSEGLLDKINDADSRRDLGMVVSSGKRLTSLINELLDMARIKNADVQLDQRPVDLRSAVNVVLRVCGELTVGKDLKLDNAIPESIPAAFVDENRIVQVLYNLIGNAIKFTERGSIRVAAEVKDDKIEMSVVDTGIGIPADKLELVFKEFEQADGSTNRKFAGTGLGLSISKVLIEQHGGAMWVETELGSGSTFFFTVPISSEEAIRDSAADTDRLSPLRLDTDRVSDDNAMVTSVASGPSSEMIRILIVDDEPINHQVLKNHLSDDRYQVASAMSGQEALEELEGEARFDLVLLDVMMPGMSGYEVCTAIRSKHLPSELPVIMITAKNQVQDLVQGLNIGANDYMAKPFSKQEFLARLGTHLNLHRINRASSRFVPSEFIRTLGKDSITDIQLGDNIARQVTVFFSDIRGYTGLAEGMEPDDNFSFVNGYAQRMGPVIRNNNGFVNQFLGDGIMALFQQSPADALQAAVDMQEVIRSYNIERVASGREPIKVGMGMHTGQLIMGIIGDDIRSDAAIIADTVNFAARVEGLTKHYQTNVLLSEASYSALPPAMQEQCRYLGLVQVKGKQNALGIYESLEGIAPKGKNAKLMTKDIFGAGIEAYLRGDFDQAALSFSKVIESNAEDDTARIFLERAVRMRESGMPKGWTGVTEMDNK